jgi:hypothetical protein
MIEVAGLELDICPWLPESTPALNLRICYLAHADVGVCEMPPGSNRSPYIDRCNLEAGGKVGDYWCASWVTKIWRTAGALVPKKGLAPSCDEWIKFAKKNGLYVPHTETPEPGWAAIYGNRAKPADGIHISIITRNRPIISGVEGNTSLAGNFDRNGVAVDFKAAALARVLGYVQPKAA